MYTSTIVSVTSNEADLVPTLKYMRTKHNTHIHTHTWLSYKGKYYKPNFIKTLRFKWRKNKKNVKNMLPLQSQGK